MAARRAARRSARSPPANGSRRLDLFEFILIITSVIFALGVAEVLSGLSRLAQAPGRIRAFAPHTLWVVVLFMFIFLVWWATWEFRGVEWAFAQYAYLLLAPTLLYFACSLLLPREVAGDEVDLERHFFRVRRPLMASFIAFTVVIVLDGPLLGTEPLVHPVRIAHGIWLGAGVWGFASENGRHHLALATTVLVIQVALTATRFWSVG